MLEIEDPYGNPIPNAYLILCEECKKKWDNLKIYLNKELDFKEELLSALDKLNRIRSPLAHGASKHLKLPKLKNQDLIKTLIDKKKIVLK